MGGSWGNDEWIFKGGYGPFQIINRLISTAEGDDQKVIPLMDLFSPPPLLDMEPLPRPALSVVEVLTGRLLNAACAEEYI